MGILIKDNYIQQSANNTTDCNTHSKSDSLGKTVLSVGASAVAGYGTYVLGSIASYPAYKAFKQSIHSVSELENSCFDTNLNKALLDLKQKHKNARIIDLSRADIGESLFANYLGKKRYVRLKKRIDYMTELVAQNSNKGVPKSYIENMVTDSMLQRNWLTRIQKSDVEGCIKGNSVIFTNKAFVNRKKAAITGYHELGHINKIHTVLGYLNKLKILVLPAICACAILKKSDNNENNQSGVTNFIKNNCVGLALLTQLPTLADEAIASVRGTQFARRTDLDKNLLGKLNKFHGKAYLTYILGSLTVAGSILAASKVRDAI